MSKQKNFGVLFIVGLSLFFVNGTLASIYTAAGEVFEEISGLRALLMVAITFTIVAMILRYFCSKTNSRSYTSTVLTVLSMLSVLVASGGDFTLTKALIIAAFIVSIFVFMFSFSIDESHYRRKPFFVGSSLFLVLTAMGWASI